MLLYLIPRLTIVRKIPPLLADTGMVTSDLSDSVLVLEH